MFTRTRKTFRFWGMVGAQRHAVAPITIKGYNLGNALRSVSVARPVLAIFALLYPPTWTHPAVLVPLLAIVGVMGYSLFQAVVLWRDPAKLLRFETAASQFAAMGGKTKALFWGLVIGAMALVAAIGLLGDPRGRATFVCDLIALGSVLYCAGWLARSALKDSELSDEERSLIGIRAAIDYISAGLIVLGLALTVLWIAMVVCAAIFMFYVLKLVLESGALSGSSGSSSSDSKPFDFFGGDSTPAPKKTFSSPDMNIDADGRMTSKFGGNFLGRVDQNGSVSDSSGWHLGKLGSDGKIRK